MNVWLALGSASLLVWGGLVYVVRTPTGWVHVPLVIGVLLLVRAIAESGPAKSPNSRAGSVPPGA